MGAATRVPSQGSPLAVGPSIWQRRRWRLCSTATTAWPAITIDASRRRELMRDLGLSAYRFNISWSRVLPADGQNRPRGLDFYERLVDALRMASSAATCSLGSAGRADDRGGWPGPTLHSGSPTTPPSFSRSSTIASSFGPPWLNLVVRTEGIAQAPRRSSQSIEAPIATPATAARRAAVAAYRAHGKHRSGSW